MLKLMPVTEKNWMSAAALSVHEDQQRFLAPAVGILARGYAYRDLFAKVFLIEDDGEPVGLALIHDFSEEPYGYDLEQFMIDRKHQGKGFGSEALRMILDVLRKEGRYDHVEVCVDRENLPALHLFEKNGFTDSGYIDPDVPGSVNLYLKLF